MRPLMSSRVGVLKWIGALQLIFGLFLFIFTIVFFAIDFDESRKALNINITTFYPLYSQHINYVYTSILLAISAGVAGASMSRYKGLMHNISARNVGIALSAGSAFSAMMTMTYSGTTIFYFIDKENILEDKASSSVKAVVSFVIINFAFCFFVLLTAFAFIVLGLLWMPNEKSDMSPLSYNREMRGPEPEVREVYYSPGTGGYGNGYYGGAEPYYGGGYRTFPALKY